MAFTLLDAKSLWDKLKNDSKALSGTASARLGTMAMGLESFQSYEELQNKLKEIFKIADVAYPETSHALHLKTTLLTALSRMVDEEAPGKCRSC